MNGHCLVPTIRKTLLWIILFWGPGIAAASGPPSARPAPGPEVVDPAPASYQQTYKRLARAWRAGDSKTLASMVYPGGLKVTRGGGGDRTVTYSPDQAFYYFRNRFQNTRTGRFTLARVQRNPQAERVHALATWDHDGPGGSQTTRLVLVLSRQDGDWYLSEITTIK